jgi:hypothetical protein
VTEIILNVEIVKPTRIAVAHVLPDLYGVAAPLGFLRGYQLDIKVIDVMCAKIRQQVTLAAKLTKM